MKDVFQHTLKGLYFPLVHIFKLQIICCNTDIKYYITTLSQKQFNVDYMN